MNQYKYKYFFLPKKFKAIADIHIAFTEFKTSGKMVVREKIDLVKGLFSNDGTGERTFVEIPNGDTIYIERKLLVPVPLFFKAEKKFQEQVKACIQLKEREKLFLNFPPKKIYVSSSRLKCAINGDFENINSSAVCYAWFVWEKGYKSQTIIDWIN